MSTPQIISNAEGRKLLGKDALTLVKRSKFGVRTDEIGKRKRTVGGVLFASVREAKRFVVLRQRERIGEIADLQLQEKFPLHAVTPKGARVRLGEYRADFTYRITKTGLWVTEDSKGHRTRDYIWKKKHVEAEYGITIVET